MDLKGQTALVLGALGRAGSAVARKFCEEGASLMLSSRRAAEGEQYAAALREEGFEVAFTPADVMQRDQVAAAVDRTVEHFGRIDVLANCFSFDYLRRFVDDTEDAWDRAIAVNYKGAMVACQEALRHMIPQRFGPSLFVAH